MTDRTETDLDRRRPGRLLAAWKWASRWSGSSALVNAVSLTLIVALGSLLTVRSNVLLRRDSEQVVHSFEVMRAADQVLMGALDAETGQRGYLISGDAAFLVPYEEAVSGRIPGALARLEILTSDNPQQLRQIRDLQDLTDRKLKELQQTLAIGKERGLEAGRVIVTDRLGKEVMDRIRSATQAVQNTEGALLAARSAEVRRVEAKIILTITLTTIFTSMIRMFMRCGEEIDMNRLFLRGHGYAGVAACDVGVKPALTGPSLMVEALLL